MPYHHFTPIERGQLHAMKQAGQTNAAIARALGRHRSTIGRELSRNNAETKKAYCPEQAQKRYHDRRRECLRSKRLDHLPLRSYILREGSRARSPEQLAGRLRLEFPHDGHMHVAPETIYRTIYRDEGLGRMLIPQLRQARKHRRKKGMGRHSRNTFGIPNRVPIEQRPQKSSSGRDTGTGKATSISPTRFLRTNGPETKTPTDLYANIFRKEPALRTFPSRRLIPLYINSITDPENLWESERHAKSLWQQLLHLQFESAKAGTAFCKWRGRPLP